ncbi:RNI-like protein [Gonapodya prolifera JEL478]|uniref:RNI-like protein n=1 Tax=Gonapodya prolifera (strain JEL478) TaxID=1344416 RepID=A0A139ABN6_GONPJ|nr:RNI-like protein [Gonapodya prolifera JEL478]|eukprot:KXS14089.1 RNI-like protein [Gonapodya prolifera JEL478]
MAPPRPPPVLPPELIAHVIHHAFGPRGYNPRFASHRALVSSRFATVSRAWWAAARRLLYSVIVVEGLGVLQKLVDAVGGGGVDALPRVEELRLSLRTSSDTRRLWSREDVLDPLLNSRKWDVHGLIPSLLARVSEAGVLRILDLQGTQLDDTASLAIADTVTRNARLDKVVLAGCAMTPQAVETVVRALVGSRVAYLDIERNSLALATTDALATLLSSTSPACRLRTLRASAGGVDAQGMEILLRAVGKCASLEVLAVDGNAIGNGPAARALSDMLAQSSSLKELVVADCAVGPMGARLVAQGLMACGSVERVFMARNLAGDDGALALLSALAVPGSALRELDLDMNYVSLRVKQHARDVVAQVATEQGRKVDVWVNG